MTRTTVLGWMLAATACNSMALSLGRPHGPAVLGQPLAVSFDLRLDAEDNVESACIEAEVIQGDTRIDPSRVRTVVTGSGQNAVVKVTTSTAIDEPVVTVNLKAGSVRISVCEAVSEIGCWVNFILIQAPARPPEAPPTA